MTSSTTPTSTSKATYTAAVIGCGKAQRGQASRDHGGFRIGYAHGGMYAHCPRTTLAAAADISLENLNAFLDHFKVERQHGYDDYRKMLQEVRPDIVSICTYVGTHRQMIEDCAKAGVKGVICEKPFVNSPADLAAVRRIADETGLKISIAHQRRTNPVFDRARQLYNDGTIGQRVMCMAGIGGWDMSEWGSHWLDIFRFFHNDEPVEWVMGQVRVSDRRGFGHAMEDHASAYFRFQGGGVGLVDAGHGITAPHTMMLVGTEGSIAVTGESTLRIDARGERREETPTHDSGQNDHTCMIAELVEWIEGGPVSVLGLPRTYGSAELNLAVYLSAVKGDRIDLPLSEELLATDEWPVEILARRAKAGGIA